MDDIIKSQPMPPTPTPQPPPPLPLSPPVKQPEPPTSVPVKDVAIPLMPQISIDSINFPLEKKSTIKSNPKFVPNDGPKKIDPTLFIPNPNRPAFKNKIDEDTDLVIYIDSARFLPDNINITKIKVSFYNRFMKVIGNETEYTKILLLDSEIFSPMFQLKVELTKENYDISEGLWMIISFYTLEVGDRMGINTSILYAYSIFPLVVTGKNMKDPAVFGYNNLLINHGAYQIPLYNPRQTRETLEELVLAIE